MELNDLKRLMVGDWVYNTHNRKNEQVQEVLCISVMLDYNDIYNSSEIEPVKLTPEILKRNGFTALQFYSELVISNKNEHTHVMWDGSHLTAKKMGRGTIELARCYYVHQLQQALRQLEIEKEIKL